MPQGSGKTGRSSGAPDAPRRAPGSRGDRAPACRAGKSLPRQPKSARPWNIQWRAPAPPRHRRRRRRPSPRRRSKPRQWRQAKRNPGGSGWGDVSGLQRTVRSGCPPMMRSWLLSRHTRHSGRCYKPEAGSWNAHERTWCPANGGEIHAAAGRRQVVEVGSLRRPRVKARIRTLVVMEVRMPADRSVRRRNGSLPPGLIPARHRPMA